MPVELYCPSCHRGYAASPKTPAALLLARLSEEGPWSALGDGQTFEDSVVATLAEQGVACPSCGGEVTVREDSLGRMTMELLGSW